MLSILDAVQAAQKRNEERDAANAMRPRMISPELEPIMPVQPILARQDGGKGDASKPDTRTPAEKYRDAVRANKYVGAIPGFGAAISLMNDSYIQNYEAQNPGDILPGQRYSKLGRLLGFGDPGTTGISGVFGENSDLYDAGLFDLGEGYQTNGIEFGYRGDAYQVESGGGMGPSDSGPQEDHGFGPGNEDGWD